MARQRINDTQIEAQDAWSAVAYSAGWGDYDSVEWFGGQYMKDSLGFVHMRGLVKNISGATKATNEVAFTLPAGFRPSRKLRLLCGVGGASFHATWLDIHTDGTARCQVAIPATEWISISPIIFRAEQ